jgi:mono/diheme cytochrome c family protein
MNRTWWLLLVTSALVCVAQNVPEVVRQGEQVFAKSCATGYCHGAKGTPGGAPRLAGRGFDQAYIGATVASGIPGTGMPAFAGTLSLPELVAVVAYVATLNGIANPNVNAGPPAATAPAGPVLSAEAARGRDLFSDAVRGFARCSTCHEVNGIGIPVATPISQIPANAQALKTLATPQVLTAILGAESMPSLIVSQTSRVIFYDLTTSPPVLRTVDPASVTISGGSTWKHSMVTASYNEGDMAAVLAYLRAVMKP